MKTRKYKEDDRIGELTDVHDDMPSENAGYVKGLETMIEARFLDPELVISPGQQFISLGMIAINLQNTKTLPEGLTKATKKTFASLFKFCSGTPLHLIVITNKKSLKSVGRFLSGLVSSLVSMRVILSPGWRWRRMKGVKVCNTQVLVKHSQPPIICNNDNYNTYCYRCLHWTPGPRPPSQGSCCCAP